MRDANPTRSSRARRARRDRSDAERRLWHTHIAAAKFVRQDPIGVDGVDFVCRERRLVVEVNGGQHATDKRGAAREQWVSDHGYGVLVFSINDALATTDGVLESIAAAWRKSASIASNTAGAQNRGDAPSPRPFPRMRGEGAPSRCQEKAP